MLHVAAEYNMSLPERRSDFIEECYESSLIEMPGRIASHQSLLNNTGHHVTVSLNILVCARKSNTNRICTSCRKPASRHADNNGIGRLSFSQPNWRLPPPIAAAASATATPKALVTSVDNTPWFSHQTQSGRRRMPNRIVYRRRQWYNNKCLI